MRLVTYATGGTPPAAGLDDDGGRIFDLAGLGVVGHGGEAPALLSLIREWDRWRSPVMAAAQRVASGDGEAAPVDEPRLLAPFPRPHRDAFAIAGNYAKHVTASQRTTGLPLEERKRAYFFMKPTGTFAGPHDPIEYDSDVTNAVDYEVELAVVIGRGGRDISVDVAMEHVFGYMVVNDVSARDLQIVKPQVDYLRGKGLDTFFPMGPGITVREWLPDHRGLHMELLVNGETRQSSSTDHMTRDVPEIIAELSRGLTLMPGDIIATGTPEGVALEMDEPRYLQDGDVVEARIASLGRLVNHVRTRRR